MYTLNWYVLNEIYDRYRIPLMVVENGLGAYDEKGEDGTGDLSRERKESFFWYKKVIGINGKDLA